MNLDELRSVRRTERQKDSLQHLRDSFYEDVAAYIAERKAERRRAADAAEDPFADPEVGQLTDEIETAEDVVEAIYERRVGKVVKLASFAAADMSADTDGLTAEERELFENLVSRIKQNRRNVLDVLAGEGGDATTGESSAETGGPQSASAGSPSEAAASPTGAGTPPTEAGAPRTEAGSASPTDPESADPTASEPADPQVTEGQADAPTDPKAVSPDDVLADAMGGDERPDGDASPSDATDDEPTESPGDASGGDRPEDVPPDLPPDAPPDATASETPVIGDSGVDAESGQGEPRTDGAPGRAENGRDSAGTVGEADPTERVTLRITEDVGAILGVDEREYDLESEDVVTLPTTNAGPLIERDAAERLD
jgi:DNA replication factor GINS